MSLRGMLMGYSPWGQLGAFMKRWFAVGLCALFLAGRAEADPQAAISSEARLKMQSDVDQCHSRAFTSHRDGAQCINEAIQRVLISIDYPYMDLVQMVSAYRIACAERIDSGAFTKDDCEKRMAELRLHVTAEESRRVHATQSANGAVLPAEGPPQTDYEALLNGSAEWYDGADTPEAKPSQITCFKRGAMIFCV